MEYLKIGDEIAGIIMRREMLAGVAGFFTPGHLSLQAGVMSYTALHVVPRHFHRPQHRQVVGTPEVIFVQQGSLTLDFYADPDAAAQSMVLHEGDLAILYGGGHGFTATTDVRILEIKQGPYLEADDKVPF